MQSFTDLLNVNENVTLDNPFLNDIMPTVQTGNINTRLNIVKTAKRLLFQDKSYTIDEAVESGIIPFLIDCLKMPNDILQSHSLDMLYDIGIEVTKYLQTIIDYGAVPILIEFFSSPNLSIRSTSFQILGWLLDQQPLIFDECMNLGLHDILVSAITPNTSLDEWAYLSLIISYCQPNKELLKLVEQFLTTLENHLFSNKIETALSDISFILCNFCVDEKELCQMVINCGILKKLVPMLDASRDYFTSGILDTFGNLADHQNFNQYIIDSGILNMVEKLFMCCEETSTDKDIMESVAYMLFHFVKNPELIQAIFDSDIIYSIIDLSEWSPFKEVFAGMLQNLLKQCSPKQAQKIIKMNAISALSKNLDKDASINDNEKLIENILDTFLIVFQKDENTKPICDEMEEYGVVEKIKILQNHENKEIREVAAKLVETYFFAKSANVINYSMKEENDFEFL